jgi:hypothetical protein
MCLWKLIEDKPTRTAGPEAARQFPESTRPLHMLFECKVARPFFLQDVVMAARRALRASGVRTGGGWKIVHAVVESDPERYKRSGDEQETTLLECWIRGLLLGEGDPELGKRIMAALASRRRATDDPS